MHHLDYTDFGTVADVTYAINYEKFGVGIFKVFKI